MRILLTTLALLLQGSLPPASALVVGTFNIRYANKGDTEHGNG